MTPRRPHRSEPQEWTANAAAVRAAAHAARAHFWALVETGFFEQSARHAALFRELASLLGERETEAAAQAEKGEAGA